MPAAPSCTSATSTPNIIGTRCRPSIRTLPMRSWAPTPTARRAETELPAPRLRAGMRHGRMTVPGVHA